MVARLRCDVSWLTKDCIPCNTVRQRRRNLWERETEARDVETILICLAKRVDEVWRKEKHGDKLCDSTTSGVKKERRVQSGPAARTQRKNREENLDRFRSHISGTHFLSIIKVSSPFRKPKSSQVFDKGEWGKLKEIRSGSVLQILRNRSRLCLSALTVLKKPQ